VHTPQQLVAQVNCAGVEVVASQITGGYTPAPGAFLPYRAGITVVAGSGAGLIHTPALWVAGVIRARVQVVTGNRLPGNADSVGAVVPDGAGIAVGARPEMFEMNAPCGRLAEVVGTLVAVVAVQGNPPLAHSIQASLRHRALVAFVARLGLVDVQSLAVAGFGYALVGIAVRVRSRGERADNLGAGLLNAQIWGLRFVAEELSQALVGLAHEQAVFVSLTVAVSGEPDALPGEATVTVGAGVAVIAGQGIELVLAAQFGVTKLVRAWILVVAGKRGPHALPLFTVIADGARVAVKAFSPGSRLVDAPARAQAFICGAWIVIVTRNFVDDSVAIVIQAVADLLGRCCSITLSKALFAADPLARTNPELVGL